ncbi:MAG: DUF4124 domain-containing protein [Pseudomonadota bacterium]
MAVISKTALPAVCALLLLVLGLPVLAETTYYRWQDDKGNLVHSDRPPDAGVPYEVITSGSNLVRKVDADEGAVPATTEPTVSNDFEPVESKTKPVKKNAEQCQRARDNLETLNTKVRIQIRNDQGELRPISEEEKEIQRQKALDAISVHC